MRRKAWLFPKLSLTGTVECPSATVVSRCPGWDSEFDLGAIVLGWLSGFSAANVFDFSSSVHPQRPW